VARDQLSNNRVGLLLVLPSVVSLAAVVVAFALPRSFPEKKELSHTIQGPVTFKAAPEFGKVAVGGVEVSSFSIYRVWFWNSGDLPLKDIPVSFVFDDILGNFQVESVYYATTPSYEFGDVRSEKVSSTHVRFVCQLLNRGDEVLVTFITKGKSELVVESKLEGMEEVALHPEEESRRWSYRVVLSAGLLSFVASVLSGLFRLSYERQPRQAEAYTYVGAGIVALAGLVVCFGWFANIDLLKSILPQWVTMKFSTALSFFLAGCMLLVRSQDQKDYWRYSHAVSAFLILGIMAAFLLSTLLSVDLGLERLFPVDDTDSPFTTVPGRPSTMTMAAFCLIGLAGLFLKPNDQWMVLSGLVVTTVGALALIGYLIGAPILYFATQYSTAMAAHTAILFVICGAVIAAHPGRRVREETVDSTAG